MEPSEAWIRQRASETAEPGLRAALTELLAARAEMALLRKVADIVQRGFHVIDGVGYWKGGANNEWTEIDWRDLRDALMDLRASPAPSPPAGHSPGGTDWSEPDNLAARRAHEECVRLDKQMSASPPAAPEPAAGRVDSKPSLRIFTYKGDLEIEVVSSANAQECMRYAEQRAATAEAERDRLSERLIEVIAQREKLVAEVARLSSAQAAQGAGDVDRLGNIIFTFLDEQARRDCVSNPALDLPESRSLARMILAARGAAGDAPK